MRGKPVDQLVFERLFPNRPDNPDPNAFAAPSNFAGFLQRYLVIEVRHETHAFYGHLDTLEAKYPGLDYNNRIHRVRLSRWPWHRRLFRAFDALRLTPREISNLTRWEGTRWAKERFEREQGFVIRDTAADDIPPFVKPEYRSPTGSASPPQSPPHTQEEPIPRVEGAEMEPHEDENMAESGTNDEHVDPPSPSAATVRSPQEPQQLQPRAVYQPYVASQRQRERLRYIGDTLNSQMENHISRGTPNDLTNSSLADELEWLKDEIEAAELPYVAHLRARSLSPIAGLFSSLILEAGTARRWGEVRDIADFIKDWIRRSPDEVRAAQPIPAVLAEYRQFMLAKYGPFRAWEADGRSPPTPRWTMRWEMATPPSTSTMMMPQAAP